MAELPSFDKTLSASHVDPDHSIALDLPTGVFEAHNITVNGNFTLIEGEDGQDFTVAFRFRPSNPKFTRGWRAVVNWYWLVEGDVLRFTRTWINEFTLERIH